MCGFFGSVGIELDQLNVSEALISLSRRGPDQQKVFRDPNGNIILGHTRLAIIDLTMDGSQPMHSTDDRYVIVFNGEIYNYLDIKKEIGNDYQWKSNSDTEVILAAYAKWGIKCLDKLRGMFSFGIWDKKNHELFAARDRFGVKPLYYAFNPDRRFFCFASRPRVIENLYNNIGFEMNYEVLNCYYSHGYIPAPMTINKHIHKLEPGCCLFLTNNELRTERYWELNEIGTNYSLINQSEESLLEELDTRLAEAVKLRMVSDVEVGLFLSGGIDSSLLAYYMTQNSTATINSYTVGFNEKELDESQYASDIAKYLGLNHHTQILRPDDLLELMPAYIREFDEPFYDYAAFPLMAVARMASRELKVCLSGDGGDELFGGYTYYTNAQKIHRLFGLPKFIRKSLTMPFTSLSRNFRLLHHTISQDSIFSGFGFMRSVIKNDTTVLDDAIMHQGIRMNGLFEKFAGKLDNIDEIEKLLRIDIKYILAEDYLQKVDVSTMAFSIEAREPLLDHKLAEWAAALPSNWKIRNGENKYLLRKLAYSKIPQHLLDRPKMGFRVPISKWLRGELKPWASDLFGKLEDKNDFGLNKKEILKLWQRHLSGEDHHTILWTILVLLQYFENRTGNKILN